MWAEKCYFIILFKYIYNDHLTNSGPSSFIIHTIVYFYNLGCIYKTENSSFRIFILQYHFTLWELYIRFYIF